MSELLNMARDLSPAAIGALGAAAAFLAVLAVGAQVTAARVARDLRFTERELVDGATGLLPRSALRVRLGAEIAWAATSATPITVAELRIRGSRFNHAARVLRHAMREEESAFLLGEQRVAVELWDTDALAAASAALRLGESLARAGHPVVDIGLGTSPGDGGDVETLLIAARRDLRPADEPRRSDCAAATRSRRSSSAAYTVSRLWGVLPWLLAMGAVLLLAWRLLPSPMAAALADDRTTSDLLVGAIAAIGIPLGAALVYISAWNLGGGASPRSRPIGRAGWGTALIVAGVVGLPLAWGIFAPDAPVSISPGFGASIGLLALITLTLAQARQLIHVRPVVLIVLTALGALITWACVEWSDLPVLADAGRLLVAASFGALLASFVERASWLVGLAALVSVTDAWSVWSDSGVTNQLLDSSNSGGNRLVDLVLFTGPSTTGGSLFAVGTTDLVFLALFLAWSHDWRIDVRVAIGALIASSWATLAVSELLEEAVPMLPFLCVAMIMLLIIRSIRLRGRVAKWSGSGGN